MANDIGACTTERPLVFDGAYDPHLDHFRDLASEYPVVLRTPISVLRDVHRGYVQAGCDVLQTLTWDLYPAVAGAAPQREVIALAAKQAARVARETAENAPKGRPRCRIAGIVPPARADGCCGDAALEFESSTTSVIAAGLIEGGADILVPALQQSILGAHAAVAGLEKAFDQTGGRRPFILSFDVGPIGLLSGDLLADAFELGERVGALSVGLNLTSHWEVLDSRPFGIERRQALRHILSDAGYAQMTEAGAQYSLSPRAYAELTVSYARHLKLSYVGGGWGVSPAHIRELRFELDTNY